MTSETPAPGARSSPGLFDGVLARGPAREAVGDHAWLQAMLDVEAALARACALAGLIPAEAAEAIAAACREERFDVAGLSEAAAASGSPVVPLVAALVDAVGEPASAHVHRGATTQDVLDTAAMLVVRRALAAVLADLDGAAAAALRLVAEHRDTPTAGRTLLQQALPTTFGLKAAGWMTALDAAAARLDALRRSALPAQFGGAVGSLSATGPAGLEVAAHLAAQLRLAQPVLPWHVHRGPILAVAGGLGEAAAVVGKIARDVTLLAQTELGEVAEGGPADRGGSSTLPQKHNPVAAVAAVACAAQAPGLVATLLTAAQHHEHERAAGSWHAEWRPLTELLRSVASGSAWLRDCLEGLQVDARRMRANLDLTGGAVLAERVAAALADYVGRAEAHRVVGAALHASATSGLSFADCVTKAPIALEHLGEDRLRALLDPARGLESAGALVDRAMQAHATAVAARGEGP